MRPSTEARLVDLDSFGERQLIAATDLGEITLLEEDSPILHSKNDAKVTSIVSVSSTVSLVFTEKNNGRRSATAYSGPILQPIAGLTLHEVFAGTLLSAELQTIAVLTPAAIRLLKFNVNDTPKAKNLKTIDFKGCRSCCASAPADHTLLVATESEYQLLDLNTGLRSPLFPIMPKIVPLMSRLGRDFIVVQGTGLTEPAMGLFVDTKGEVARQGAVIQWTSYPSSLAASEEHVFSVINDALVVHRFNGSKDILEDVTIEIENHSARSKVCKVVKLSYPVRVLSEELLSRLGDSTVALVESEIAFVLDTNEVHLWKPVPRLVELEQRIADNELLDVEPDARFSNSEQGIAELRYLSTFLTLHLLAENKVSQAAKEWRSGAQLDINLILYIYNFEELMPQKTLPGLRGLVESLHQKNLDGKLDVSFLINGLRHTIKKSRRGPSEEIKKLEKLLAKLLCSDPEWESELMRFLLEKDLLAKSEILDWMYQERYVDLLEKYYSFSADPVNLFYLNLKIFHDTGFPIARVRRAVESLTTPTSIEIMASSQEYDMWVLVLEILNDERVDSELGIKLLLWPEFQSNHNESEILQMLKEQSNSGEAWRRYLKFLVHKKGMFKGDLVTLVTADIVSLTQALPARSHLQLTYERFAKAQWPKPKYRDWLLSAPNQKDSYDYDSLLNLQKELWELMGDELDWVQLMSTFDSLLPDFKSERAYIYKKLGLHEQSLELLVSIKDFMSVINYHEDFKDEPSTQRDLIILSLRILLRIQTDQAGGKNKLQGYKVLRDFLRAGANLSEVSSVLKLLDSSTPFWVVADFIFVKLRDFQFHENKARILHSIAKSATREKNPILNN